MPHQCVRCGKLYDDGSNVILSGCECGAKLFFFVRKEKLEAMKKVQVNLSTEQKIQIEKDVLELAGAEESHEHAVILDFESIRITEPGKYELDLVNLFGKNPLVYKLEEGKYIIDLSATFKQKSNLP